MRDLLTVYRRHGLPRSGSALYGYHTKFCTKRPTVHHNTVVIQFCVCVPAVMVGPTSYKLHILEWRVSQKFNSDCSGIDDNFNRQWNYTINLNLEFSVCMLVYKVRQMVNRSPHTTCYFIDPWIRWGWEASTTNLDRNNEHLSGKNHSRHWAVVGYLKSKLWYEEKSLGIVRNLVNKAKLVHNLFLVYLSNLYRFRATMCPLSRETTVSMRHLVLVILKQVDTLKLQGRMS